MQCNIHQLEEGFTYKKFACFGKAEAKIFWSVEKSSHSLNKVGSSSVRASLANRMPANHNWRETVAEKRLDGERGMMKVTAIVFLTPFLPFDRSTMDSTQRILVGRSKDRRSMSKEKQSYAFYSKGTRAKWNARVLTCISFESYSFEANNWSYTYVHVLLVLMRICWFCWKQSGQRSNQQLWKKKIHNSQVSKFCEYFAAYEPKRFVYSTKRNAYFPAEYFSKLASFRHASTHTQSQKNTSSSHLSLARRHSHHSETPDDRYWADECTKLMTSARKWCSNIARSISSLFNAVAVI